MYGVVTVLALPLPEIDWYEVHISFSIIVSYFQTHFLMLMNAVFTFSKAPCFCLWGGRQPGARQCTLCLPPWQRPAYSTPFILHQPYFKSAHSSVFIHSAFAISKDPYWSLIEWASSKPEKKNPLLFNEKNVMSFFFRTNKNVLWRHEYHIRYMKSILFTPLRKKNIRYLIMRCLLCFHGSTQCVKRQKTTRIVIKT